VSLLRQKKRLVEENKKMKKHKEERRRKRKKRRKGIPRVKVSVVFICACLVISAPVVLFWIRVRDHSRYLCL